MRRSLSTTTALIASLSLALPAPVTGQTTPAPACSDGSAAPCLPGLEPLGEDGKPLPGTTMTDEEIQARKAAEDAEAAARAAEEAAKAAADAKATEDAKAADEAAAAEAQKAAEEAARAAEQGARSKAEDKGAPTEAPAEAPADGTGIALPEAETVPAEAPPAEPPAEAAPAETPPAETAPAGNADPAHQAAPEEAPATVPEAAPVTAPEAAPATGAAPEATVAPVPGDAPAADAGAAPGATPGAAPAAAPAATGGEEQPPETAAPAAPARGGDHPNPETGIATEPAAAAGDTVVPDLPVQPDAVTGEAPAATAAAAAAPDATGGGAEGVPADATVVEETVTEGSVRSSSEDFANKVNQPLTAEQAAAAAAPATATARKKKGLSDFEKAVLIGLGAVAVGAILSNNRRVAANSGDRVVVERQDGSYEVIKDDDALLRQPGSAVRTERFRDGSVRTTVTRSDGSRIVTIRDAGYRVLRRVHIDPDGRQTVLIDDTAAYDPVVVSQLPPPRKPREVSLDDEMALRLALEQDAPRVGRRFSLAQVRGIPEVRALAPAIDLREITFETGSSAIRPDQARVLSTLGRVIEDLVAANPNEVFLVEGHTDAVGNAAYNLALSDRRAESVALALTEYFDIPPENLVVQGYGEEFLKVDTQGAERANRRATVRRITDLLRQAAAD